MNKLDKTYTDLIGDAYRDWCNYYRKENNGLEPWPIEVWLERIKTDDEFAKKWGLKIKERELSLEERQKLCVVWTEDSYGIDGELRSPLTIDWEKTPKRAITITYNNQTIESYE
jgi:hypothetical protein